MLFQWVFKRNVLNIQYCSLCDTPSRVYTAVLNAHALGVDKIDFKVKGGVFKKIISKALRYYECFSTTNSWNRDQVIMSKEEFW